MADEESDGKGHLSRSTEVRTDVKATRSKRRGRRIQQGSWAGLWRGQRQQLGAVASVAKIGDGRTLRRFEDEANGSTSARVGSI